VRAVVLPAMIVIIAVFQVAMTLVLRRRRENVAPRGKGTIPSQLLDGAERTWIVFTTPWCATCEPVVERLRLAEPASNVRMVDATVERELADSLRVRSAPTAVLADEDGVVHAQLVGVDAVSSYLDGTT